MANGNFVQLLSGGKVNFGEELLYYSEARSAAITGNVVTFNDTNNDGFNLDANTNRRVIIRNITQNVSYDISNQAVTANSLVADLAPGNVINGTHTAPVATDRFDIRVYETPTYLGVTTLTNNLEYEYDEFSDESSNRLRSYIIKRTPSLAGEIENYSFENIRRVCALEELDGNTNSLLMADNVDLTRGIAVIDEQITIPTAGRPAEEYTFTFFNCEMKPNGEMTINPRAGRRKLPFMLDVNYDSVSFQWFMYHKANA